MCWLQARRWRPSVIWLYQKIWARNDWEHLTVKLAVLILRSCLVLVIFMSKYCNTVKKYKEKKQQATFSTSFFLFSRIPACLWWSQWLDVNLDGYPGVSRVRGSNRMQTAYRIDSTANLAMPTL
jgi:hypothetical protein